MGWRLLAVLTFVPVLLIFVLIVVLMVVITPAAWVIGGPGTVHCIWNWQWPNHFMEFPYRLAVRGGK